MESHFSVMLFIYRYYRGQATCKYSARPINKSSRRTINKIAMLNWRRNKHVLRTDECQLSKSKSATWETRDGDWSYRRFHGQLISRRKIAWTFRFGHASSHATRRLTRAVCLKSEAISYEARISGRARPSRQRCKSLSCDPSVYGPARTSTQSAEYRPEELSPSRFPIAAAAPDNRRGSLKARRNRHFYDRI